MGAIPKTGAQDARLLNISGSEGLFRKRGIHIQSTAPIMVYTHIYASVSSGATALVPVQAWGGLYTSVNSEQIDAGGAAFSWMYVIAAYDNTVVEITPSVTTRGGQTAGVPFTVNLNKGQVYQIGGTSDASGNGPNLTGTKIRSLTSPTGYIHPIGVFSGSSRTRGESDPCGTGSGRDNDIQQHFPRQSWGKKYLLAPNSASTSASTFMTNVYKVVVTDPATVVHRNGVVIPPADLITGTYYKFSSNQPELIEADQPILVAQFMSGASLCNPGPQGDPEMIYWSPISQGSKDAYFYRHNRTAISTNYVTLIIPTPGLASLTIDGSSTFDHIYAHPQMAGYSVVIKKWTAAPAQVTIMSDTSFIGITYGLGSAESYGYNIGTKISALNARDASVLPPGFTGVLRVTLLDFNAVKTGSDVLLKWTTSHEINFNKFEVERSLNGTEFDRFATVSPNQSGAYHATDANALKLFIANPVLYYRLKMIDKDGKFKYSGIVAVKTGNIRSLQVHVAPNPFNDKLQLQVQTETAGMMKINIRDISGKLIESRSKFINPGSSVIDISDLASLQKGIYIIELEMNGIRQQVRAVK